MPIYTRRGDEGLTDLGDQSRVSKTSPRIEASGTVDELNALLGTVIPSGFDDIDEEIRSVQQHLHIIQAELAQPTSNGSGPRIRQSHVEMLEKWIDDHDEEIEPLRHFILPGGSRIGARLHFVRAVSRRTERRVVRLDESESINEFVLTYLNRVSDLFFTLARVVNARMDEPEERPNYA